MTRRPPTSTTVAATLARVDSLMPPRVDQREQGEEQHGDESDRQRHEGGEVVAPEAAGERGHGDDAGGEHAEARDEAGERSEGAGGVVGGRRPPSGTSWPARRRRRRSASPGAGRRAAAPTPLRRRRRPPAPPGRRPRRRARRPGMKECTAAVRVSVRRVPGRPARPRGRCFPSLAMASQVSRRTGNTPRSCRAPRRESAGWVRMRHPPDASTRPQLCGRLPWFAPFLRRAFFLRRRFEDINASPLALTYYPPVCRPGGSQSPPPPVYAAANSPARNAHGWLTSRLCSRGVRPGPDGPRTPSSPGRRRLSSSCGRTRGK